METPTRQNDYWLWKNSIWQKSRTLQEICLYHSEVKYKYMAVGPMLWINLAWDKLNSVPNVCGLVFLHFTSLCAWDLVFKASVCRLIFLLVWFMWSPELSGCFGMFESQIPNNSKYNVKQPQQSPQFLLE